MAGASRREVEAVANAVRKIPGLCFEDEERFLYNLARRKGNLVELGCWKGRTTAILVKAAAVWRAKVTAVDSFMTMSKKKFGKQATRKLWEANLKAVGLEPPELLEMTTDEAAKVYDREIAFLFIDAGHSKPYIEQDLQNWTPKIKLGGIVALHDMFNPLAPAICQAVTDWWCREKVGTMLTWELIGLQHFTIAFRRLK